MGGLLLLGTPCSMKAVFTGPMDGTSMLHLCIEEASRRASSSVISLISGGTNSGRGDAAHCTACLCRHDRHVRKVSDLHWALKLGLWAPHTFDGILHAKDVRLCDWLDSSDCQVLRHLGDLRPLTELSAWWQSVE